MSQKWLYFAAGIVAGMYVVPVVLAKIGKKA